MSEPATPTLKRRSGTEIRNRTRVIGFRANADEEGQLALAADRAGLTVGSYVRSRALSTPTTRAMRRATADRAALAQLIGQIGKIGSNLNQLARSENRGRADDEAGEAILQNLKELNELKRACMLALGYDQP